MSNKSNHNQSIKILSTYNYIITKNSKFYLIYISLSFFIQSIVKSVFLLIKFMYIKSKSFL